MHDNHLGGESRPLMLGTTEQEGFEPSDLLQSLDFKASAISQTLPLLQNHQLGNALTSFVATPYELVL